MRHVYWGFGSGTLPDSPIGQVVEEILTKNMRFWLEDGIIKSRPLRHMVATGESVLESVKATEDLAAGRRLPRLAFLEGVQYVERAARELYALDQRTVDVIEAMALVAETHKAEALGAFLVESSSQPFPMEVFPDETSAVAWLKSVTEAGETG